MLGKAYRLPFRLLGIPVLLDVTFLIILPFLAWIIARDLPAYFKWFQIATQADEISEGTRYFLGLMSALGLFGSVLIHELGHSVVGKAYHLEVRNITLWVLGGMAQFERMPRKKGAEAVIAVAGPVTSYLLAAASWIVLQLIPAGVWQLQFWLAYLFNMNLLLATFNLLPALPLDGGRILRSLLALWLPQLKATQISATLSKTLAFFLGLLGLLNLEIFLVLIAFFIYMAVSSEARQVVFTEVLGEIPIRELMSAPVRTVDAGMTLSDLVQKMFRERHLGYPVLDSAGNIEGLITLEDVQRCREDWGRYSQAPVGSVVNRKMETIEQDQTALEAFRKMSRNEFQRLLVVTPSGEIVGIVSKTDLMRALQIRLVEVELDDVKESVLP